MPRYFFHSRDGVSYRDRSGLELPDLDAAGIEAVRYMSELLRDESAEVWRNGELQLAIVDEDDEELCVLTIVKSERPAAERRRSAPPRL